MLNDVIIFNRSLLNRNPGTGVMCNTQQDYDLLAQWLDFEGRHIGHNQHMGLWSNFTPRLPCVAFPANGSIGYPSEKYEGKSISMTDAMMFEDRARQWRDSNGEHPLYGRCHVDHNGPLAYDQYFDDGTNELLIFTIVKWEKSIMLDPIDATEPRKPELTFPRTMLAGSYRGSDLKPATVFWLGEDGTALFTYRAIDNLTPQFGQWAAQHGYAEEMPDGYEVPMELKDIVELVHSRAWFCTKVAQDEEGDWFSNPNISNIGVNVGSAFYTFNTLVWLSEDEYFAGEPNKRKGKPLMKLVKHV